jgi:hypothetical protein
MDNIKRPKDMTPPQYRKKYGGCPDDYQKKINGKYWCNPAHCSKSWDNKKERDEHLSRAYDALM